MIEKTEYELNNNITIEKLKEVGFREFSSNNKRSLVYYRQLIIDIDLYIEFDITNSNVLEFDEDKNVSVIDDVIGQYCGAFYNKVDNDYVRRITRRYNEVMNNLVDKGIFKLKGKVKKLEKIK